MNNDLKPGKGAHLVVNGEMLDYLTTSLDQVRQAYEDADGDQGYDQDAKDFFGAIVDQLVGDGNAGWDYLKDNFGEKLVRFTEYPDGECRVTLVLTKKGEIRLDIRPWIEY